MQRYFKVTVNGKEYDVTVDELSIGASMMPNYLGSPVTAASAQVVGHPSASPTPTTPSPVASGSGDQCAQMGGVVSAILVKEGQSVTEGEKILELEAMKMKVPLTATCSGKVSKVLVAVGDAVSAGQPLVTIS